MHEFRGIEWHAIADEAATAAELIGMGATAHARADFSRRANYWQAFFALATGFERAAKLALVIDAILSGQPVPDRKALQKRGHKVKDLLDEVGMLATALGVETLDSDDGVQSAVIEVLDLFGRNYSRYHNFDLLTEEEASLTDSPILAWHQTVMLVVLDRHYTEAQMERDIAQAMRVAPFEDFARIRFADEAGASIDSLTLSQLRGAEARFARRWERMYILRIARFLGDVLEALGSRGFGLDPRIPNLMEFFALYQNDDAYLRSRKTWSIYRP